MKHYIDKDALVAHLATLLDKKKYSDEYEVAFRDGNNSAIYAISHFLNTLEVKEVELEKEIKEEYLKRRQYDGKVNMLVILNEPQFNEIAKHFFELGLRSTITEEDCKLIWNIGDDLPYMPEEEFFKELLRRYKAQKGE